MPKKRRSRQRQRFTPRPAPVDTPRGERDFGARETIRPRFARPGTIGRAIGEPSVTLVKAATAEVAYVRSDLRRISVVAGVCVALLALATLLADFVLK